MAYEVFKMITFFGYFILILSVISIMFGARDSASLFLLLIAIIISILIIIFSVLVAIGRIRLPVITKKSQ